MRTVQTSLHRFFDLGPRCSRLGSSSPRGRDFAFVGDPYRRGDVIVNALMRVTDLSQDFDTRYA